MNLCKLLQQKCLEPCWGGYIQPAGSPYILNTCHQFCRDGYPDRTYCLILEDSSSILKIDLPEITISSVDFMTFELFYCLMTKLWDPVFRFWFFTKLNPNMLTPYLRSVWKWNPKEPFDYYFLGLSYVICQNYDPVHFEMDLVQIVVWQSNQAH